MLREKFPQSYLLFQKELKGVDKILIVFKIDGIEALHPEVE